MAVDHAAYLGGYTVSVNFARYWINPVYISTVSDFLPSHNSAILLSRYFMFFAFLVFWVFLPFDTYNYTAFAFKSQAFN